MIRWTPPTETAHPERAAESKGPTRSCARYRRCTICRTPQLVVRGRVVVHQRHLEVNGKAASWDCLGSRRLIMPLVELVPLIGAIAAEAPRPLQEVTCPHCRDEVLVLDGRLAFHRHLVRYRYPCSAGGKRLKPPDENNDPPDPYGGKKPPKSLTALVFAGIAAGRVEDMVAQLAKKLRLSRFAVLRQCVPRWGPTRPSNAELLMDEAGPVLAAAVPLCKERTQKWLNLHQTAADTLVNAQVVLSHAMQCPVKLIGGLNEYKWIDGQLILDRHIIGNAGGRFLDALPFARRGRVRPDELQSVHNAYGDLSGTYSADHVAKNYAKLRGDGRAVRELRKEDRPIVSFAEGKNGDLWDSTGHRFSRRYIPSGTYATRSALREVTYSKHLREWSRAVKQILDTSHRYLWKKVAAVRKSMRWVTYREAISEPDERRQFIQARQIGRGISVCAHFRRTNRHHLNNEERSLNGDATPSLRSGSLSGVTPVEQPGNDATGPPSRISEDRKGAGRGAGARSVPPTPAAALVHTHDADLVVLEALLVSDPEDW